MRGSASYHRKCFSRSFGKLRMTAGVEGRIGNTIESGYNPVVILSRRQRMTVGMQFLNTEQDDGG